jgi:hypothetical protein
MAIVLREEVSRLAKLLSEQVVAMGMLKHGSDPRLRVFCTR